MLINMVQVDRLALCKCLFFFVFFLLFLSKTTLACTVFNFTLFFGEHPCNVDLFTIRFRVVWI